MSVDPYDGPDRFFYPIQITTANNQFEFQEDSNGFETVTIPEGTYWVHNDTNITTEYPSFFQEVTFQIQQLGSVNGTYKFKPHDLFNTINYSSVRLNETTSTYSFEIDFNPPSTIDARLFGLADNRSISSSSNSITGFRSLYGVWQTPKEKADGRKDIRGDQFTSHQSPDAVTNSWDFVEDRYFKYHKIPAAFVYADRADFTDYADEAELRQEDDHNCFEYLWRGFRRGDVLALYGKGNTNTNLTLTGNTYSRDRSEALMMRAEHTKKLKEHFDRVFKYPSENYDIMFTASVQETSSLPGYNH